MKLIFTLLALFALFAGSLGVQVEKWTRYTDSTCTNTNGLSVMYFYRPYGAQAGSPACVHDYALGWVIVSREADNYYPPKNQYILQAYIYLDNHCGDLQSIELGNTPVSPSTCDYYHNLENHCYPSSEISQKSSCNPGPSPQPGNCDSTPPTNVCGSANEQEYLMLMCPPNTVLAAFTYANYGHPSINPPCDQSWTDDSCSLDVRVQIFNACNGKNVCYYWVDPNVLPNPCWGEYKNLAVLAKCYPLHPCAYT